MNSFVESVLTANNNATRKQLYYKCPYCGKINDIRTCSCRLTKESFSNIFRKELKGK